MARTAKAGTATAKTKSGTKTAAKRPAASRSKRAAAPGNPFETIKIERDGGIAFVIMNRPEKRNAMSPQLHMEMSEALDELVDAYPEQWPIAVVTDEGELGRSATERGATVLSNGQLLDLFIAD